MAQVPKNLSVSEILGAIGPARMAAFDSWPFAELFLTAAMFNHKDALKALAAKAKTTLAWNRDGTPMMSGGATPTQLNCLSNADANAIIALCDATTTITDPPQIWSGQIMSVQVNRRNCVVTIKYTRSTDGFTFSEDVPGVNTQAQWADYINRECLALDVRDAAAAQVTIGPVARA